MLFYHYLCNRFTLLFYHYLCSRFTLLFYHYLCSRFTLLFYHYLTGLLCSSITIYVAGLLCSSITIYVTGLLSALALGSAMCSHAGPLFTDEDQKMVVSSHHTKAICDKKKLCYIQKQSKITKNVFTFLNQSIP